MISTWGTNGPRPEPDPENAALFGAFTASASIEVDCAPQLAWELVTAIDRIGEFSPECIGATWIDGATGPEVGARFEGTNRVADEQTGTEMTWIRPCTVTVAREPEQFSYTVGDRFDGTPATEWEYLIAPSTAGCRITQRFAHLADGLSGIRSMADANPQQAPQIVAGRTQALELGIATTLAAMKAVLEQSN